MKKSDTCRGCQFGMQAVNGREQDGYCVEKPPVLVVIEGKATGSFPPVNLDHFRCGDHTPRNWFLRFMRGIISR